MTDVTGDALSMDELRALADVARHAVIAAVRSGGPAASAGLEGGDRITAINGDAVRNFAELQGTIGTYSPGDTVSVTIVRGGRTQSVEVTLGEI